MLDGIASYLSGNVASVAVAMLVLKMPVILLSRSQLSTPGAAAALA